MRIQINKFLLCFAITLTILFALGRAHGDDYSVYKSNQTLISEFQVKQQPNGDFKIFESGKPVISKFTVKKTPDGYSVYKTGQPIIPLYRVRSDQPLNSIVPQKP